jgi:hypothetical protein
MNNPIAWTLMELLAIRLTKQKTLGKSLVMAAVFGLSAMATEAAEVSLSGFGTLGYAQSNQSYNFERFIDNNGTFARDSIAGVQADIKITDEIGATVQGKFAPSIDNDNSWNGTLSWAFLSWRPSNDWLIRAGKQRLPVYLYSESTDVGVTYDFAHLPAEMYSISPSTDYVGISVAKTWNPDLGELTLDGYAGNIGTSWRIYQRDNVPLPPPAQPGVSFKDISVDSRGLALTLLRDEDKYRASMHTQTTSISPASPGAYSQLSAAQLGLPFVAAGAAYMPQTSVTNVNSVVYTLSAEIKLPQDFRAIGEYGRRKITNALTGIDTNGGYFSLLKDIDAWTPYVSYAVIKSRADALSLYQAMNGNANGLIDLGIGGPAVAAAVAGINASQRVLADGLLVYDQNTIALGTSYRLSPTQKIKMEWARTHVGVASSFVDAPSFGNVSNQNIDVLSFSYNVVF